MVPVALALILLPLVAYLWCRRHNIKYPPCPISPWPILGHLLVLKECPREQLKSFRKQCGDIFSLYMGPTHVVIFNGVDVIKEAFIKQADVFSDRAEIYLTMAFGSAHNGIANSNGDSWKEQRSISINILRRFGLGKNILADRIEEEMNHYFELLDSLKGVPTDVSSHTMLPVANIICSVIIGKRFEYSQERFNRMVRLLCYNFTHLKGTTLLNYFPFLRFLPGDVFKLKIIQSNFQEFVDIFANVYVKENENVTDEPTNYITAYMQEMKKKQLAGESSHRNKQNLFRCIFDIFAGGTETIASTIDWVFLYLINYPQVQEKAFCEIEVVVGLHRAPGMQDKSKLNYLAAVIMEVQRISSIAPLTLPRIVRKDVTFGGYLIPKGAHIIANMDSMLHDQKVWGDDSDQFRPERFIDKDGGLIYREDWVPYLFGRRVCLGEGLAKMELFLFLANVIQQFQILPPDPENIPPIKGTFGLSHTPHHFKARLVRRQC